MIAKPAPTENDHRWRGVDALLLLVATIWGVNFSVVKFALAGLSPLALNAIRYAVAACVLLVVARIGGHSLRIARRDLPFMVGLGLLGHGIYQMLFVYGADLTTADNASLMLSTTPVWVALFGTLAGTERVAPRGWLGVGLAVVGVVIVSTGARDAEFTFGGASLEGDLLVFAGTLCWATYTFLSRRALARYPTMTVAAVTTTIGAIPIVLAGIPGLRANLVARPVADVAPGVYLAAAASGFFAIAVAMALWSYGVARVGSARTALYNNLVLPIAVITAWLTLGESLTATQIAGVALAIFGVASARRHTHQI